MGIFIPSLTISHLQSTLIMRIPSFPLILLPEPLRPPPCSCLHVIIVFFLFRLFLFLSSFSSSSFPLVLPVGMLPICSDHVIALLPSLRSHLYGKFHSFIFFKIYFILCVWAFACMYVFAVHVCLTYLEAGKGWWIPRNWNYR